MIDDIDEPAPYSRLLKLADVMRRTALGQSAIYLGCQRGEFPRPLKVTSKAVAWRSDEVEAWIAARPRATAGMAPRRRVESVVADREDL